MDMRIFSILGSAFFYIRTSALESTVFWSRDRVQADEIS